MAFRSAATTVVGRLFQLLDSAGITRFRFGPGAFETETAPVLDGYVLEYTDPSWTPDVLSTGIIGSGNSLDGLRKTAQTGVYSRAEATGLRRMYSYIRVQTTMGVPAFPLLDESRIELYAGKRSINSGGLYVSCDVNGNTDIGIGAGTVSVNAQVGAVNLFGDDVKLNGVSLPRGFLTGIQAGNVATDTTGVFVATTAAVLFEVGRRYRIMSGYRALNAVGGGVSMNTKVFHNGLQCVSHDWWASAEGFGFTNGNHTSFQEGTGSTATFRMFTATTAGTLTVFSPYIIVEDIGAI